MLLFLFGLVSIGCAQTADQVSGDGATTKRPTNYTECVAAGFPALRSYPGKCIAYGETFVDENVKAPDFKAEPEHAQAAAKLCVNMCGDGQCQEIVCMGSGCPCAESAESCPQDCK